MTEPTVRTGIDELAKALAAAQGEMKNATLNKVNPHFRSKYADLAAIRDATIPALSKNGLSIIQYTKLHGESLVLHTRLLHSSGQYMESEYPLPMAVDKPQVMGSAYTYAKRYSWAAMTGTSADEDDDANAAQAEGVAPSPPAQKKSNDPAWKGPLKSHALETALRALDHDMRGAADSAELDQIVKDAKAIIDQAKVDRPVWINGDGADIMGVKNVAEMMRAQFKAEAERQAAYDLPDPDNPQSYMEAG